jgi:hypothetical protein
MRVKLPPKPKLLLVTAVCFLLRASAQGEQAAMSNEIKRIHFAERVVVIELARASSPSLRAARENCATACAESGALELSIGLIGVSRGSYSSDALINLLGLRLDGAGSEELDCQILLRGSTLISRLRRLQARQVVEHCQALYLDVRGRELVNVRDVNMEQVCRSEVEIRRGQVELLEAIKEKALCEE